MIKTIVQSKTTLPRATQQTYNTAKPASVVIPTATHDDIARRAHEIYIKKGRPQGQSEQNWLQAEQELRNQGMTARPKQR